jgi:hypothetical protein
MTTAKDLLQEWLKFPVTGALANFHKMQNLILRTEAYIQNSDSKLYDVIMLFGWCRGGITIDTMHPVTFLETHFGLTYEEAWIFVDNLPRTLKTQIPKSEAEELCKKLTIAGIDHKMFPSNPKLSDL